MAWMIVPFTKAVNSQWFDTLGMVVSTWKIWSRIKIVSRPIDEGLTRTRMAEMVRRK